MGQSVGGDANARVDNLEVQAVGLTLHDQRNLPFLGELDGVAQQVQQDLAQAVWVALHKLTHIGPDVAAQDQVFALGLDRLLGAQLIDQFVEREIHQLQFDGSALQLGGVEDVVEQVQQAARRLVHDLQLLAGPTGQFAHQHQLGEAQDGVHRGADFMAHVGQEGAAGLCGLLGALFGLHERGLHLMPLGDVQQHAVYPGRVAIGMTDHIAVAPDPT